MISYHPIDGHIHIKDEPGLDLCALTDAMEEICTANDMESYAIMSIPCWDIHHALQNPLAILQKALHPRTTYFFGGMDYYIYPNYPYECRFEKQLDTLLDIGIDGVKLIETKPTARKLLNGFRFTEPAYEKLFETLEEKQIPILWHVGDPETFWDPELVPQDARKNGWFYGDGTFPLKEELYHEVNTILSRFPKLSATFAHFFFLSADPERADRFLTEHPNVRIDITPGSEMYRNFTQRRDDYRAFFLKHQDRLVLGTDSGWCTGRGMEVKVEQAVSCLTNIHRFLSTEDHFILSGFQVHGLGLPKETVRKIEHDNFVRVVAPQPKPLNMDAVLSYFDHIRTLLRSDACALPNRQALLVRLDEIQSLLP